MQLITHQSHIDQLPDSPLTTYIKKRFGQLSEDTDVPPTMILLESNDDPAGCDFSFIGSNGLLSDLYDEHTPREEGFISPYEWVSIQRNLNLIEILYLEGYDFGYWIMIPLDIAGAHPDLLHVLTSQGLSDPQPL